MPAGLRIEELNKLSRRLQRGSSLRLKPFHPFTVASATLSEKGDVEIAVEVGEMH